MALNTQWRSRILLNWLAKGTFWCALWKQMYFNSDNVIGIFTQGYQIVRHGRETRRLLGVLSKRLVYQAFPAVRSLLLQSLLLLCTISIRRNYAHCSGLRVSTTSRLDSPLMNSHFTELYTLSVYLSCNPYVGIYVTFLPLRPFKGRNHVHFTCAHKSPDTNPYLLMYFFQIGWPHWTQFFLILGGFYFLGLG